jgi:hypothetical protein
VAVSPVDPTPPTPPAPAPPTPPAPAPEEKDETARTVTLSIDSEPPGAEVTDSQSGEVLGSTPFQGRFPARDGAARLALHKAGFRPKKVTLTLQRDQTLTVTLDKQAAPVTRRRGEAGKSRDEDNDRRKL